MSIRVERDTCAFVGRLLVSKENGIIAICRDKVRRLLRHVFHWSTRPLCGFLRNFSHYAIDHWCFRSGITSWLRSTTGDIVCHEGHQFDVESNAVVLRHWSIAPSSTVGCRCNPNRQFAVADLIGICFAWFDPTSVMSMRCGAELQYFTGFAIAILEYLC